MRDDPADALRALEREAQRPHRAERGAGDRRALELQRIEQRAELRDRVAAQRAARVVERVAEPEPGQVDGVDPAVAELREHRRPRRRRHPAAVHEHERLAGARLEHAHGERRVGQREVPARRPRRRSPRAARARLPGRPAQDRSWRGSLHRARRLSLPERAPRTWRRGHRVGAWSSSRRLDLRSLLTRAEAAAPVGVVDAMAAALREMLGAHDVSFLIADFSGRSLNRLGHTAANGEPGFRSEETAGAGAARRLALRGRARDAALRGAAGGRRHPRHRARDQPRRGGRRAGAHPALRARPGDPRGHRARRPPARLHGDRQPPLHRPLRMGPAHGPGVAGGRDPAPAAPRDLHLRGGPVHARRLAASRPGRSAATRSTSRSTATRCTCR